ncbi:membrane protein [Rhodococcus phage Reynauld]|uniref:Membrane protein n=1 Tax=Rhodococcus phage Reynauld TaxID=3062845 RepID=A0ACD4UHG9_9CAUD|nr:membrane protein [Rhodococcus phage Reynauld]
MSLTEKRRQRRIVHLVSGAVASVAALLFLRITGGDWQFAMAIAYFLAGWFGWEHGYREAAQDAGDIYRDLWDRRDR